jgi:hypothetical protein
MCYNKGMYTYTGRPGSKPGFYRALFFNNPSSSSRVHDELWPILRLIALYTDKTVILKFAFQS